ncbi:MAG TPA: NAD-dependent malic enzyme [Nitrospiraceae bacterium]|nr:NAD-dependent malic enzyme [Nitrospiraceae bacterium]
MLELTITRDPRSGEAIWEVPISGQCLIDHPLFNKGTAFTEDERRELGLLGLLPPHVNTLDEQVARAYDAYRHKDSDIERHIYLRALQDENEILFYRLMQNHIAEMMPIIYTPTVGEACLQFSHIYRHPRGLFIAYPERNDMDAILANAAFRQVEVIVVTDGERILGLGDQGTGGMGIPIGKLSLYTLCGGIHPATTLPVLLDAGTNNQEALEDPLYLGWRHERVRGQEYDDFVEAFVQGVMKRFPNVLLQWEDFAQSNAGRLLGRYRDRLCTFNDDIQGTASVTTGTLLAAVKATGSRLRDQQVVMFGAGSAGCGISEEICAAMVAEGLPEAEARARFWLIDRQGLLREGLTGLLPFQQRFVQPHARLSTWQLSNPDQIGLKEVVQNVHPTILIGASGVPGAFTEEIVREMARHQARPIIFPLSNPTSRCEAVPADLLAWTDGKALVATGSPFEDVVYKGRKIPISQCNNSYIFPGLGLGILAVGAKRVTDSMFMAASRALAHGSPAGNNPDAPLLPPLEDIRSVSRQIALAVAGEAQRAGLGKHVSGTDLERLVDAKMWAPRYARLKKRPA